MLTIKVCRGRLEGFKRWYGDSGSCGGGIWCWISNFQWGKSIKIGKEQLFWRKTVKVAIPKGINFRNTSTYPRKQGTDHHSNWCAK